MNLDLETYWKIFDYLDFKSKLRFIQVNKYFHDNLKIREIPNELIHLLNDDILKVYPSLVKLDLFSEYYSDGIHHYGCNTNITDLSYMNDMKELRISCYCGTNPCCFGDNYNIKLPQNITILDICNNPSIKINTTGLYGLRELYIGKENIIDLDTSYMPSIHIRESDVNKLENEYLSLKNFYMNCDTLQFFYKNKLEIFGYISAFEEIEGGDYYSRGFNIKYIVMLRIISSVSGKDIFEY